MEIRRAADRGQAHWGWLDSRHTFSFGHYYDPRFMGYGPLRVINEDRVAGGGGFDTHGHRDMEILSWVIEGALEHKDSLGTGSVIVPGELQRMSAGTGIRHSEFNASPSQPVHFLQIWIEPAERGLAPSYDQRAFAPDLLTGRFHRIVSPSGADGSVRIHQDVSLYAGRFHQAEAFTLSLEAGRSAWVQIVRGQVALNGEGLQAGDGAALGPNEALAFSEAINLEVLVFDLPR